MKPLIALLTILVTTVAALAAPTETRPMRIDPRALSLLARVATKYENSAWYRGEMTTTFGRAGDKTTDEIRGKLFVTNTGDLDLTRKHKGKVSRIVSDGTTILLTRSDRPRKYVLETMTTPRFKRDAILLRADCEGFVADALSRRLGQLLVWPGLQSVVAGKPERRGGALLRPITFSQVLGSGQRREYCTNTIYLAADDTIRAVEGRTTDARGTIWIWREKHWNIKMGSTPQPHPAVKAPTGFTREEPVKP